MKKFSRPKLSLRRKGGEAYGARHYIRKYWYVFFLIGIFAVSLWFRALPGRYNELIGLDEFHVYRIAEYALHNNLQIPTEQNPDMLRYSPIGVNTWWADYAMPSYLPVLVYVFISAIGISMPFFEFAIFFPAFMGAVGAIIAFLIAKELFKSNVSGLFAAFFVSMTPALFTRTSAASFEKEATAVIFMMAAVWLFVKAYNKSSWFYGILSGLSLALMSLAWGGVQYIYLFFAAFFGALFIADAALVILDYLFSGFGKSLENLEKFMGPSMLKAYVPMILLGSLIQQLTPHNIGLTSMSVLAAYGALAVLLIRYGLVKFNLVKKEKVHYIIPGLMLVMVAVFFVGITFTDFFDSIIREIFSLLTLSRGVIGSTVAENAPGDWATILSTLGTGFSSGILPQLNFLSPFFALWIFMFLGSFLLVFEFYRTHNWLLIFPLVWLVSSIWGVFFYVRLLFILGPVGGVIAGFFFGWIIGRLGKTKYLKGKSLRSKINFITLPLAIFIILLVVVNAASIYAYALSINTAICFPQYKDNQNPNPFEVIPCVTIDGNGSQVLHEDGQPWYQAMNFLSQKTPEGSVILSWWDFGYWFQTRGHRPSVADGGNLGGPYGNRDFEIAEWYTDKPENWSAWVPWMKGYNVSYIFMDYTLPGKYGAISKIASRGEQVLGFLEFRRTGMYPRTNSTIIEYTSGPYAIWLPFDDNGGLSGTPTFLVSQNGKYYSKNYINEFCTTSGIVRVANESQAMPGCIAINTYLGQEGLFYVPPEIENTIFNDLMFMQGYGLPVEKVFDNGLMQIYKVKYENQTVSGQ
ncbi:MAG: glycosyltransferase family 39 protein [Candidatus Aenigmarchaeota archaeon]|nr:glycosyltransferase family 39 protein [Candidatus Aenigmarchaeota archaeon]